MIVPRRLICSIEGKDKTGKSHLAMTAPEPIMYIDLDVGTEGVLSKCRKELLRYEVEQPGRLGSNKELMERFGDVWSDIQAQINLALDMGEGTLVIDTFTEAYDLCRLAHFGKLSQVQPHDYVKAYADLREIMRVASSTKMNIILLHKLGKEFNTGELEMKGWSDVPFQVHATLRTCREDSDTGPTFSAEVRSCRHKPELMGRVLAQGMAQGPREIPFSLDFEMLLGLVHG